MGFSKYYLLVAATVLFIALDKQSDAGLVSSELSPPLLNAKEKLDIERTIGEDGNIISKKAAKAIEEVHAFAANHTRPGPIGEALEILKVGWEKTINLVAASQVAALKLFDNIFIKDNKDKVTALNEINNGIDDIKTLIFKAGIDVHSSVGAAKSIVNITDKGEYKFAIDKIQETGTGLFDDLESAKFFVHQAVKCSSNEVKKRQLNAAHSSILSAAEMSNENLVLGAKSAIQYLSTSDEKKIMEHEPVEKLISDQAKAAAAADSDTMAAKDALNRDFDIANNLVIIPPYVLNELKRGLLDYIDYAAWAVAICDQAIIKGKELAKSDPQAAIDLIERTFSLADLIIIDGSIKAYEGIGVVGVASGLLEQFHDAIELAERSRVEGTKGFDSAKTVAVRAIASGGKAAEHALATSHKMLEANEAFIFENLDAIKTKIIDLIKLRP